MPKLASRGLISSSCTTNYFSKLISIIILHLRNAVKKNFLGFSLPGPEKKKKAFFEERKPLVLSLSFIEHNLAEFVTLHQFLAFSP